MGVLHLETAFRDGDEPDSPAPVCPRCGAPGQVSRTVSMAFWRGSGLYVISGVPVDICPSCHDEHLGRETVLALDRMRSAGLTGDRMEEAMIVPVYRFSPTAGR